jgi:DNA-binding GntR family transcriptional regulator
LSYPTAATFAYETLREWIVSQRVPPGERLELEDLALRLGVSTTPIRQAMQRLESEGLVVSQPHRGTVVRELTADEVEEVYELRRRLEGWAVELACERLDEGDRREIADLVARLDAAGPEDYLDLNRALHFRIFEAARQPLLQRFLTVLWDLSELCRNRLLAQPEQVERSRREHRRLWTLIQAGRADEAARVLREHNERTKEMVLREHSAGTPAAGA